MAAPVPAAAPPVAPAPPVPAPPAAPAPAEPAPPAPDGPEPTLRNHGERQALRPVHHRLEPGTTKHRVGEFMESRWVEFAIIILVVCDIVLVAIEAGIDHHIICVEGVHVATRQSVAVQKEGGALTDEAKAEGLKLITGLMQDGSLRRQPRGSGALLGLDPAWLGGKALAGGSARRARRQIAWPLPIVAPQGVPLLIQTSGPGPARGARVHVAEDALTANDAPPSNHSEERANKSQAIEPVRANLSQAVKTIRQEPKEGNVSAGNETKEGEKSGEEHKEGEEHGDAAAGEHGAAGEHAVGEHGAHGEAHGEAHGGHGAHGEHGHEHEHGGSLICEDRLGHHAHHISHQCHIASIVILCAFLVELLIKYWVDPEEFRSNWFHVLDFFIVLVSLIIDTALMWYIDNMKSKGMDARDLEWVIMLLLITRLWRVVRIIHGIFEVAHDEVDKLRVQKEKNEKLKEQNVELRAVLTRNNLGDQAPEALESEEEH